MTTVGADITKIVNPNRLALNPLLAVEPPEVTHIHDRFDRELREDTP